MKRRMAVADGVGYSGWMEADEDGAVERLAGCQMGLRLAGCATKRTLIELPVRAGLFNVPWNTR